MILLAAKDPLPDLLLADKLLIYGLFHQIPVCIGVNKQDLADGEAYLREYEKKRRPAPVFFRKRGKGA